jgi:hypothetical protein
MPNFLNVFICLTYSFNFQRAKTHWEPNLANNGEVPFQRQMLLPQIAGRSELTVV